MNKSNELCPLKPEKNDSVARSELTVKIRGPAAPELGKADLRFAKPVQLWITQMLKSKVHLDIFRLKDDSLADAENLPKPAILAAEIVEDLEEVLAEFRAVEQALEK
jgi:hypothetical protein